MYLQLVNSDFIKLWIFFVSLHSFSVVKITFFALECIMTFLRIALINN